MTGRGGHRATAPDGGWRPVERIDAVNPTLVRFIEERTGRVKEFDFSGLPVSAGMRQWLARTFARRTGPRSGIKRTRSAVSCFMILRLFAESLAEADKQVAGPEGLSAGQIAAFRLRHGGAEKVILVRSVLRDDPELPEPARTALLARPPRRPEPARPTAYSDHEWQLIMTALRSDVRRARDRIRAGRQLLADYRAGTVVAGSRQADLGSLLETFDSTGDLPRYDNGFIKKRVSQAGGVPAVTSRQMQLRHHGLRRDSDLGLEAADDLADGRLADVSPVLGDKTRPHPMRRVALLAVDVLVGDEPLTYDRLVGPHGRRHPFRHLSA